MIPIQAAYKLAKAAVCFGARAAYEHHDTVLYTLGAGGAIAELGVGRYDVLPYFVLASAVHEAVRAGAWWSYKPTQLVGDATKSVNSRQNTMASALIAVGAGACFSALFIAALPVEVVGTMGTGLAGCVMAMHHFLAQEGKKLADLPNIYFNKITGMWDWPSKNRGKGGTPSEQFNNAISDVITLCKEANVTGGGSLKPIPVRVRNSRPRLSNLQTASQPH
jgi:hypothetical protein